MMPFYASPLQTQIPQRPALYQDFEAQRRAAHASMPHRDTIASLKKGVDLLRQSPIESLGYVKELADVWEPAIEHAYGTGVRNKVALAAKSASWVYILADELFSGVMTYQKARGHARTCRLHYALAIVGQTALFQLIANYLIPTALVKSIQRVSRTLVARYAPPSLRKNPLFTLTLPALASSSVLLIKDPIDEGTDKLLEKTYDRWANRWLASTEAPFLGAHVPGYHNRTAIAR